MGAPDGVTWSRIRVEPIGGAAPRFGILLEQAGTGRSLVALGAVSEAELEEQLDACGGPAAYARRFGAEPLDPQGIAADASGRLVFVPRP